MLAPPKGRKTRTVPLPDAVATELAEQLRGWPAGGDDLVFTSREGKPISPSNRAGLRSTSGGAMSRHCCRS